MLRAQGPHTAPMVRGFTYRDSSILSPVISPLLPSDVSSFFFGWWSFCEIKIYVSGEEHFPCTLMLHQHWCGGPGEGHRAMSPRSAGSSTISLLTSYRKVLEPWVEQSDDSAGSSCRSSAGTTVSEPKTGPYNLRNDFLPQATYR